MKNCGFRLREKEYPFRTAKEAYLNALRALKNKNPNLYEELGHRFNNDKRGKFVRKSEDVYKRSPELEEKHVGELEPGWYTATNIDNEEKEEILISACNLAGISYKDDFEIWFFGGNNKYSPTGKEEDDQTDQLLDRLIAQQRNE